MAQSLRPLAHTRSAPSVVARPLHHVCFALASQHVGSRQLLDGRNPGSRVSAQLQQSRASVQCSSSVEPAVTTTGQTTPMPRTPVEMVRQASEAVKRGLEAGQTRQQLQLLLPVNEKEYDFLATEPVDYPCNLDKEFTTAVALVKSLLTNVCGAGTELMVKRVDDGGVEGEPCAVVYTSTKDFVAVVFPTAERLNDIKEFAKTEGRPLLIVNSQWNEEGQVISDFGFGPWKKAAMNFLGTFAPTYSLGEQRIGSPGSVNPATGARFTTGGVVRTLLAYPAQYQVFAMAADGSSQLLSSNFPDKPTYKQLDTLLNDARKAGLEIFRVAQAAANTSSEREQGEGQQLEGVLTDDNLRVEDRVEDSSALSSYDVDSLDAVGLRKTLASLGLPTSGKMSKLRERLKEVIAKEQGP